MRVPFSTPVSLATALPLEQVRQRLKESMAPTLSMFRSRSNFPLAGWVRDYHCYLYFRTWYRNSFRRVLFLEFLENDHGTKLEGSFKIPMLLLVPIACWFGFGVLFSVFWTIEWLQCKIEPMHTVGDHLIACVPYGMLLFGTGLLWFSLWLSRRTEDKTLQIVIQILNAHVRDVTPIRGKARIT